MDWKKYLAPYFSSERSDVAELLMNKIAADLPPNPTIEQQMVILARLPEMLKGLLENINKVKTDSINQMLATGIDREELDKFIAGKDVEMDKSMIQNLSNATFNRGILRFKVLLYNGTDIELTHDISLRSWRFFKKTNEKCVNMFPNTDHINFTQEQIDIYREKFYQIYKQIVQIFERLLDIQRGMVIVFTRDITVIKRVEKVFTTYKYDNISDQYLKMWEQDKDCQIGSTILIECE